MKTVWKFVLEPDKDPQTVTMPKFAEVLTAREQGSQVCIWALVDPKGPPERRLFEVVGTGWEMKDRERKYIGTASFVDGSPPVFHVFEVLGWEP